MGTFNAPLYPSTPGISLGRPDQEFDAYLLNARVQALTAATATIQTLNLQGLNGGTVFADQYSDIQTAIDALPTAGGTVDATSPNVNLAMGDIDPGTRSVTLLLGPYTYTFNQITLQTSFRILGSAPHPGHSGAPGTILQSVGADSTAAMVLGNQPTTGVILQNFRLYGANPTAGTQPGIQIVATPAGGMWWSEFRNIYISFFGGICLDFDGSAGSSSINQLITVDHVTVFRNTYDGSTPNYALRVLGAAGQISFTSCQFDGRFNTTDGGTNIRIEATSVAGFVLPYSLSFIKTTCQFANIGVHLIGTVGTTFYASHHESINGVYLLDYSAASGVGNWGTIVSSSYFANTCGINGGSGYLAKISAAAKDKSDLTYIYNGSFETPDVMVDGAESSTVVLHDNFSLVGTYGATPTLGITPTIAPAASITTLRARIVNLSSSATVIQTINSSLAPGDPITFVVQSGSATFGSSGNISLGGFTTLTLGANDSAMFVPCDLTGVYQLVGLGKNVTPWMTLDGGPNTTVSGQVSFGYASGFGDGAAATAVTTTLLGTGTGPANPQTIVSYQKINRDGVNYWIPLCQ